MARRYYSSTAARTTLASGVDDTTTTFNVVAVSGWPASFPYTLVLDQDTVNEELVEVSARSGTTLTVTRGVDGTSAVAHDAGAAVNHGVSARDFDEPNEFVNDIGSKFNVPTTNELALRPDGSTEAVRVDSSGNVGIGTTSPSALLDVDGEAEVNGLTVGRGAGDVSSNTAVGAGALAANTTGSSNTAFGDNSLAANTTGGGNTASGRNALLSNTTGGSNTAFGYEALGSNTTAGSSVAVGRAALRDNTTGNNNTAIGRNAMRENETGNSNVAVGYQALLLNTDGDDNVAIGREALLDNTTGNSNTAVGYRALYDNTTGNNNNAFGYLALSVNTDGDNNNAVGREALELNTTGSQNNAFGFRALTNTTTGIDNTAVGHNAGDSNTTGSNNTFIGHEADGASATASNTITLGDSAITTLRCQVTTITSLSDRRDKKNIQPIGAGLSFVEQLEPVAFDWNMRSGKKVDVPDMGFIAQDLLQVMEDTGVTVPNLVSQENPDALEAGYGALIPVLVQAIKELSAEVKALKEGI